MYKIVMCIHGMGEVEGSITYVSKSRAEEFARQYQDLADANNFGITYRVRPVI